FPSGLVDGDHDSSPWQPFPLRAGIALDILYLDQDGIPFLISPSQCHWEGTLRKEDETKMEAEPPRPWPTALIVTPFPASFHKKGIFIVLVADV
ncbi:MAG TPA: hypothetical protein PLV96_03700, partial [Methanoregulaceae archaeon]|nr:hypothetical protein [Methanoregulaceae archaeon]